MTASPPPPENADPRITESQRLANIHVVLAEVTSSPWASDALEIIMAAVLSPILARRAGHALVWLLVEGSPSGGKTSTIMTLGNQGRIAYIDNLTENALASGYVPKRKQDRKLDLLGQMQQSRAVALVIKDLTTLLSGKDERVSAVLGDLNSIYDGTYTKWTGTTGGVSYETHFAIVAAVTPAAVLKHHRHMSKIGTRFLSYRIPTLTPEQQQAGLTVGWVHDLQEHEARVTKLRQQVEQHVAALLAGPPPAVAVAPHHQADIDRLALLLAKIRGVVQWERGRDEVELVQIEEPFRAQAQLRTLAEGLAFVHGRTETTEHDIELLRRVVLSSAPADRAQIVTLFPGHPNGLTVKAVKDATGLGKHRAEQLLEELYRVGLVTVERGESAGGSPPRVYQPTAQFADLLARPVEPLGHLGDLGGSGDFIPSTSLRFVKKKHHPGRLHPQGGVDGTKWGLLNLVNLPWPAKRRRVHR